MCDEICRLSLDKPLQFATASGLVYPERRGTESSGNTSGSGVAR